MKRWLFFLSLVGMGVYLDSAKAMNEFSKTADSSETPVETEQEILHQISQLKPGDSSALAILERVRLMIRLLHQVSNRTKTLFSQQKIQLVQDKLEKQSSLFAQLLKKEQEHKILLWDTQTQGQLEIVEKATSGILRILDQLKHFQDLNVRVMLINIAIDYAHAIEQSSYYLKGKQLLKTAGQGLVLFPIEIMGIAVEQIGEMNQQQVESDFPKETMVWNQNFTNHLKNQQLTLLNALKQAESQFVSLSPEKQKKLLETLYQDLVRLQMEVTLVASMDSCKMAMLALEQAPTFVGKIRSIFGNANQNLRLGVSDARRMGEGWEQIYHQIFQGDLKIAQEKLISKQKSEEWLTFHQRMNQLLQAYAEADQKWIAVSQKVVFVGSLVGVALLTGGIGAYLEASVGITSGEVAGFLAATSFEGISFTVLSNSLSNEIFHKNDDLFHNFTENLAMIGGMRLLSTAYSFVVGEKAAASISGQAKLLLTQFVAIDAYALYQAEKEKLKLTGQELSTSEILDISFDNMAFTVAMSIGAKLSQPWVQKLQVQGELEGTLKKIKQEHENLGKLKEQTKPGANEDQLKELAQKQMNLLKLEQQVLAALQKLGPSAWHSLSAEELVQIDHAAMQSDLQLIQTAQLAARLEPAGPGEFFCEKGSFFDYVKNFFSKQGAKVIETKDPVDQARSLTVEQKDRPSFQITERLSKKKNVITKPPQFKAKPKSNKTNVSKEIMERAVAHAVQNIPGLSEAQARVIFQEVFSKGSSVVFGGSRVRGNWNWASDLDIGFGNLSVSQAGKILEKIAKVPGGLKIEETVIVPGNKTKIIPEIKTPEEFFMRSGTRLSPDKRAGESFFPSGYFSYGIDGTITMCRPDGMITKIP